MKLINIYRLTAGLLFFFSCSEYHENSSDRSQSGIGPFSGLSSLTSNVSAPSDFKVVGYMPYWAGDVKQIQYDRLTHINYAFVLPTANGGLKAVQNPSKLKELVRLGHANGVKVLIAVGGWNDGNDSAFEELAGDQTSRANFVNNLMNLLETYDLDGVDMDWEYPDPWGDSAQNYGFLMKELSAALHNKGKLLTAAVVAKGNTGGGILSEVFEYVDFLNLMAYDGGNNENHSPFSYAQESLDYWLGRGLPASKAILGVPFYGRPGWEPYRVIVARDSDAPFKDKSGDANYNGIETIKAKTILAMEQGGGVMMWELSQDTSDGSITQVEFFQGSLSLGVDTSSPYEIIWSNVPEGNYSLSVVATNHEGETLVSRNVSIIVNPEGACTTPPWDAEKVYWGGDIVLHNGHEWKAKWWTLGEAPAPSAWGVWEDMGTCGPGDAHSCGNAAWALKAS